MTVKAPKFRFTAVLGFFEQDRPASPPSDATTLPGLGLLDRSYETDDAFDPRRERHAWERFAYYLDHLNRVGGGRTVYKLLYAARHGEGYHNVKEAEVGTAAWEAYWAKLDGDGKTTWFDAHLTERGTSQALAMKAFWEDAAATQKLPLPTRHYASPLARCLETCEKAFTGLTPPPPETAEGDEPAVAVPPFRPVVKELLRERLGVHTCDRRRTRTWIRDHHPGFAIEAGFAEHDELWRPDVRETLAEHAVRAEGFLEDLFANDSASIVSVTAHSGTIHALYEAIGHPVVRVSPGAVVPVLVKAEALVDGEGSA
ncbi:4924f1e1-a2fa-40e0-8206-9f70fde90898 [Thermothielavioides terrestris]|uniref:Phosphoglycerate mutase-like protein n=2 Tax=Thermothielavioides terrestris TaxID=2587410 RepID=G2QWX8_THETT|nr:uncharacterized protein THITE_2109558 [Thermothielavioides terrestris NRRL 8126]AEO63944.1 hypothetical protein THITE_2109558 [Thermothielavioides terrestris NRRL 8126]SPQ23321.1 4924f1e1-a2fa-40e0-8206-9f70fde90898 [Thermothielavioides terrestris]